MSAWVWPPSVRVQPAAAGSGPVPNREPSRLDARTAFDRTDGSLEWVKVASADASWARAKGSLMGANGVTASAAAVASTEASGEPTVTV